MSHAPVWQYLTVFDRVAFLFHSKKFLLDNYNKHGNSLDLILRYSNDIQTPTWHLVCFFQSIPVEEIKDSELLHAYFNHYCSRSDNKSEILNFCRRIKYDFTKQDSLGNTAIVYLFDSPYNVDNYADIYSYKPPFSFIIDHFAELTKDEINITKDIKNKRGKTWVDIAIDFGYFLEIIQRLEFNSIKNLNIEKKSIRITDWELKVYLCKP
jgi:hypothetical protein